MFVTYQIIGVQHETDTTDGEKLEIVAGHSSESGETTLRMSGLVLLEGDDVAILILAGVGLFAPMHDCCCGCLLKYGMSIIKADAAC